MQITHRGTYGSLMAQGVDFEDLINRKEIITKGGKHIEKDEPVPTDDGASEAVSSPEIASPDLLKGPTQVYPYSSLFLFLPSVFLLPVCFSFSFLLFFRTILMHLQEEKSQLISNEERQTGKVAWDVYRKYFAASGHFWLSIRMSNLPPSCFLANVVSVTLVLYILAQVASVLSSYWLTYWAGQYVFSLVSISSFCSSPSLLQETNQLFKKIQSSKARIRDSVHCPDSRVWSTPETGASRRAVLDMQGCRYSA